MYEALEHWKQYKLKKSKLNSNQLKLAL